MASPNPPIPGTPFRVVGAAEAESEVVSTLRTTKRKLDDAFQTLDNAVSSPEIQRPPPPKKSHTIRSLYSTLAKYGIKGKEEEQEVSQQAAETALPTTRSTPHLSAILARVTKRTRKALSSRFGSSVAPLPPTADYRPSSLSTFLARLSTFKLSTYANKPSAIDAVAASKCGWINDGKERLVCGLCQASWVVAGRAGMSKDAANALLEKQRVSLVDAHKDACPWKTRQCDPTIYCIPLQSPATMVKDIRINATTLDPWLRNIEVKHPLTSTQITSLRSTLSTAVASSDTYSPASNLNTTSPDQSDNVFSDFDGGTSGPSNAAILASLFGWSLAPTVSPDTSRRLSLARANSLAQSTPPSISLSRSSSVRPISPAPSASSPVQQGTPTTPSRVSSAQFTFHMPSNVNVKRDTILHCILCQRRIGLWAFRPESPLNTAESCHNSTATDATMESTGAAESTLNFTSVPTISSKKLNTQRPFDVLKEHRAYCPYVVRSTIVPTFPVPVISGAAASASSLSLQRSNSTASVKNQSTTLEGWRAVLTVVLRYGVMQRQRLGLDFVDRLRGDTTSSDESMEFDGVKAMIAGVKKRGGKDLLQYVKGLLG
ncbi:hypothetical protein C0989_007493 [Termitomyces sp. Mn162]|nr:hypothetical protein C0989_007493 [Termitomyces sp. Mn162]